MRIGFALCLMFALGTAVPARADPYAVPIKVSAGPLAHTLQEIARQSRGELLFDHNAVASFRAPDINARTTVLGAVQAALRGTGLNVRQAASGALIVEAPAPPPLARQDVAVSELLVIGHRSQNADIRRTETDIQPYQVITADEITAAHADDVGQYVETRVTTNGAVQTFGAVVPGAANSSIDLRGLGPEQTLILVDGRRMPGFPLTALDNGQPDLNALPLHDIDRIEVLTGTAGGIYGFGALGGVINVVLAHDRPGVELNVTGGLSSRGDAGRVAFESRFEFSPDHGATDVTLDASLTRSQPLTNGERDYLVNDRRETLAANPSYLQTLLPNANDIGVFNISPDQPLTLKPQYGGGSLGASYTLIPTGLGGTPQAFAAAFQAGAGKLDLGLSSPDAASDIETNPDRESLLMNVRHQFGGGVEIYFDGIMLWNHGRYADPGASAYGATSLAPFEPDDPFQQIVYVKFPMPPSTSDYETRFDSSRFTAGVVAPLPLGWRSTAEAIWGEARYEEIQTQQGYDPIPIVGNPLGDWSQFEQILLSSPQNGVIKVQADDLYQEQSLTLAGPVFQAPGGPATLTVRADRRSETDPAYQEVGTGVDAYATSSVAARSTTTMSIYAELRSRIFADEAPSPLLRDLELQLAVRDDRQSNDFSVDPSTPGSQREHVTFTGASYTVGAKASPLPWLMLRASFATGHTPPPPEDLIESTFEDDTVFNDPKRGGTDYAGVTTTEGGSPNLKTVLASTTSVGFVLTPFGPRGLQVSLDYSHISETHAVELLNSDTVVANEGYWPQRVQRGPLTAADQALGYTAGPITSVDATAINGASVDVRTLDGRLEWSFALPSGWLHLYGTATYDFGDKQNALFTPEVDSSGFADAPLTWRANVGADWSLGTFTAGANLQYFGSYNVGLSGPAGAFNEFVYLYQGSETEPAQVYLDLHVSKRMHINRNDLRFDLGVNDVLDTPPPRLTNLAGGLGGVSLYGDPRRRRFQLSVSALF